MQNSNNTGTVIGALLVGVAIGATLGVLFAPEEGTKTRKKIADSRDDISDAIKEKYDQFVDFVEDVKKDLIKVKERADSLMESEKDKVELNDILS